MGLHAIQVRMGILVFCFDGQGQGFNRSKVQLGDFLAMRFLCFQPDSDRRYRIGKSNRRLEGPG